MVNQPERQPGNGRPGLVRARERRGLTQEEAAELVGVSVTTWSRWERAEQSMRPAYRMRIARAWQVPVEEVERWLVTDQPRPDATPEPEPDADIGAAGWCAESAARLWRWEIDTSRRHLLAALPFTPAALGEWLLAWSFDPPAPVSLSSGTARVGMADVQAIHEALQAFTRMDHQFGAGLVRPAVTDFLASKVAPLLHGSAADDVRAQLFTAASQMTRLAGWMAFDLARHGLAQQHLGQALKLAKQAGDGLTGAWALATLAQQACDLGQRRWAIRLASAAVDAATKSGAPSRVRAELLIRQARALAVTGSQSLDSSEQHEAYTVREVSKLLAQAETAFARDADGHDLAWSATFHEAEMAAEIGYCWQLAGQHRRAAACAEMALKGFGADFPRSTQFNQLHAARSYLELGELDRALTYARQAVPATGTLASARARALMDDFSQRLRPYRTYAGVREFEDYRRSRLSS
ncbi:helix-turn-helix transcriptional regulator [Nonomuraea sp. NPDC049504]|uniref:helix-turn-helix transcriptional regulator n=1 Tax=Nonomuraea sp. NPDC049504 TaxID=3154729 RepID=UPI0034148E1F